MLVFGGQNLRIQFKTSLFLSITLLLNSIEMCRLYRSYRRYRRRHFCKDGLPIVYVHIKIYTSDTVCGTARSKCQAAKSRARMICYRSNIVPKSFQDRFKNQNRSKNNGKNSSFLQLNHGRQVCQIAKIVEKLKRVKKPRPGARQCTIWNEKFWKKELLGFFRIIYGLPNDEARRIFRTFSP